MARRPPAENSFTDLMESIEEEVAEWAQDVVDTVTRAFMPDGRPFQMEKRTQREQMLEYRALRGSPDAWQQWMDNLQAQIDSRLAQISTDYSTGVDPVELTRRYALAYSAKMERLMEAEQRKASAALSLPAARLPGVDDDEEEDL